MRLFACVVFGKQGVLLDGYEGVGSWMLKHARSLKKKDDSGEDLGT